MSIIGDLLRPNRTAVPKEFRNLSLTDYSQWVDLGILTPTDSGVNVSANTALKVSAVFASVRILAETLASLPLILYKRQERGKTRAPDHGLYDLLKTRPNDEMTSFEYRETLMSHLALYGNAYSTIETDGRGRVRELFPLRPDNMLQIVKVDGRWAYQYQFPDGRPQWFDQSQIWHLRGLASDGRIGYSPIFLMRQAVGLGLAAESFGARFFGNDARPGVVLEHPGSLSPEAQKTLRESWVSRHGGLDKSHRVAILEEGLTVKEIGLPPEDAQFIETRKFQISEIARMYRIPPHMLADLGDATFSNIEHQGIEFVTHTMRPWLVRWEQSIQQNLMLPADRSRFFVEFLVDSLLRGDTKSRFEAYSLARNNGWFSANDIRELENMNPIEGGDVYLVPLNMVPAEQLDDPTAAASRDAGDQVSRQKQAREDRALNGRRRLISASRELFLEALGRVIRREIQDLRKLSKKFLTRDVPEFSLALNTFYEKHRTFINNQMRPVFRSYGELVAGEAAGEVQSEVMSDEDLDAWADLYVDDFAAHHIGISTNEIRKLLADAVREGEDPAELLDAMLDQWEETRVENVANIETVRSNNAAAVAAYVFAGRTILVWRAFGKNCPYCSKLNGRTVDIRDPFLSEGEDFEPEGADGALTPSHDVRHPPAHKGCDCMITAG